MTRRFWVYFPSQYFLRPTPRVLFPPRGRSSQAHAQARRTTPCPTVRLFPFPTEVFCVAAVDMLERWFSSSLETPLRVFISSRVG